MKNKLIIMLSLVCIVAFGLFGLSACGGADAWVIVNTGLNAMGEEIIDSTYRQEGEAMPEIETPTKAGYKFVGWDKEIPDVVPAGEFTITAIWELEDTPEEAFKFNNGEITGLKSEYNDLLGIKIPASIGGVKVNKIGLRAFESKDFIDVVIAEGVKVIDESAFSQADIYNSITMPSTITSIGQNAFYSCKFSQIALPENLTSIGAAAFEKCFDLTSINIPSKVIIIGDGAFRGCTALTGITVAQGNSMFKAVDGNLYNITVTTLVQYAIGKTDTLYEAPNTCGAIRNYAFSGNNHLKKIHIGGLLNAERCAFVNCYALEEFNVPLSDVYQTDTDGVLYKIVDNSRLQLVKWPQAKRGPVTVKSGVKDILDYAFFDCDDLGIVNLPSTLESIGALAFAGCDNLSGINYDGTMANFEGITKGVAWYSGGLATFVACNDGNYTIVG